MDYKPLFRVVLGLVGMCGVASAPVAAIAIPAIARAASATLSAPASAAGGAWIEVSWTGPCDGYDRVHIVRVGTPDGDIVDANAIYANASVPARMLAPEEAGEYEIRYYDTNAKAIIARRGFVVTPMKQVTLKAPATAVPTAEAKHETDRPQPSVAWVRPSEMPTLLGSKFVRRGIDLQAELTRRARRTPGAAVSKASRRITRTSIARPGTASPSITDQEGLGL